MSLGERLDTDLGGPDTDKRNADGITRCQSMMVNEDQHRENWTKIRETMSVPGDSLCSQWVKQKAREDVIRHGNIGRATRSGNFAEKGLAYKKETQREEKEDQRQIDQKVQHHQGLTVFQ